MVRILYKPLGLLFGALGGVVAGAVFKRLWALLGHQDDAPTTTDPDRSWTEVLTAAALQGAVFALVKAAIDRGGAVGTRRLTGTWPD
ncbi:MULTISPECIES: DUF4235 domain-containing protein [unclassified Streptomyces]|uniref:DUF4235 domain-containing protein n=1 Tax=Streptomycetaceae TaxID=2062 RepID=UPI0005F99A5B|nr:MULTISPECIES: DUF4235 domain-containing protein [unclassified Streptomyces]KJY28324.1 membrane protein [Streptomyces sp. NRRL S-495]KOV35043.1 membrane protein [Streptomyces sp. XY431]